VTFEKELNIVKDYLALEHIVLKTGCRWNMISDEDTLDQPIPRDAADPWENALSMVSVTRWVAGK